MRFRFINRVVLECRERKHPGYHVCVTKQNLESWVELARPRLAIAAIIGLIGHYISH